MLPVDPAFMRPSQVLRRGDSVPLKWSCKGGCKTALAAATDGIYLCPQSVCRLGHAARIIILLRQVAAHDGASSSSRWGPICQAALPAVSAQGAVAHAVVVQLDAGAAKRENWDAFKVFVLHPVLVGMRGT